MRLLKTADIYLAPALYGESFGIVLLEAMAMGTPIAGFANQGYLNILSSEQRKYFVDPEDLEGLIQSINKLMASKELLTSLSEHGHELVEQYDWNIQAKKIEKIYSNIIWHQKTKYQPFYP